MITLLAMRSKVQESSDQKAWLKQHGEAVNDTRCQHITDHSSSIQPRQKGNCYRARRYGSVAVLHCTWSQHSTSITSPSPLLARLLLAPREKKVMCMCIDRIREVQSENLRTVMRSKIRKVVAYHAWS